jgi:hypothetical protein
MSEDKLSEVKSIIQGMNEILKKLDGIGLANEIIYFGSYLRGGIKATINTKSGLHGDLYGIEPRPSREEQRIRSCELNLEKAKEVYEFYKKASQKARYSLKGGRNGTDIKSEDLERLKKRVEQAELNLEIAKGLDPGKAYEREKQKVRDQIEKDRLESEDGVRVWQEGWRAKASSLKEKSE